MTVTTAWTPLQIGDVTLEHRVVLAPLTRARGTRSHIDNQTYVANELMLQYYAERTTPGGLLISEAAPVSLRASGIYGIPGWFTTEQQASWKEIISTVHRKGGIWFTQLWHQGRNTHSAFTGSQPESSSSVAQGGQIAWSGFAARPYETPREMTTEGIQQAQDDFVECAKAVRRAGGDGVEIHAGNGYLFDQFHHSNINKRTDEYGGDLYNRCRFTLETVGKLCEAIGSGRVGVRLSPYGFFNETYGEQRLEQWTYLCNELAKRNVAYVHLIEPRFDEFKSASEKEAMLGELAMDQPTLKPFKDALGGTPLLSAGGFGPDNFQTGINTGCHDFVAFGRYFIANPDLVDRLKSSTPLYKWDRSTFYGPFERNEIGYTVHPSRIVSSRADRLKGQLAD